MYPLLELGFDFFKIYIGTFVLAENLASTLTGGSMVRPSFMMRIASRGIRV